jgi:hypothetical protein
MWLFLGYDRFDLLRVRTVLLVLTRLRIVQNLAVFSEALEGNGPIQNDL